MDKKRIYICLSFIIITIQGCSDSTVLIPTISPASMNITATSETKAATELPSSCSEFNLTPEECANLGSNAYSYVETAFEPCDQTDTGATTFTILFVSNGVVINSPENNSATPDLKVSPNNYSGTYETDTGTVYTTDTVFTLEGFTSTFTRISGSGCSTFSTYTLSSPTTTSLLTSTATLSPTALPQTTATVISLQTEWLFQVTVTIEQLGPVLGGTMGGQSGYNWGILETQTPIQEGINPASVYSPTGQMCAQGMLVEGQPMVTSLTSGACSVEIPVP